MLCNKAPVVMHIRVVSKGSSMMAAMSSPTPYNGASHSDGARCTARSTELTQGSRQGHWSLTLRHNALPVTMSQRTNVRPWRASSSVPSCPCHCISMTAPGPWTLTSTCDSVTSHTSMMPEVSADARVGKGGRAERLDHLTRHTGET